MKKLILTLLLVSTGALAQPSPEIRLFDMPDGTRYTMRDSDFVVHGNGWSTKMHMYYESKKHTFNAIATCTEDGGTITFYDADNKTSYRWFPDGPTVYDDLASSFCAIWERLR
jgi:hypothetical protein